MIDKAHIKWVAFHVGDGTPDADIAPLDDVASETIGLPARISAPVGVPVVITSEGTPLHKIIAISPVVLILIAPRRSPHALTLISFALAHGYAVSTSDTVTVMRRDDIDPNDHHPEGSGE